MIRPSPYRLVLAAALAALTLLAAIPAHADSIWNSPACATGEITDYAIGDEETGDESVIRLDGQTALCEPRPRLGTDADPHQFGLIVYAEEGARIGALTEYQPGPAPTAFTYLVDHTVDWGDGPVVAMCLAYKEDGRLSCVGVNFANNPSVFPISVDDPRVDHLPLDRECGSCVSDPGRE